MVRPDHQQQCPLGASCPLQLRDQSLQLGQHLRPAPVSDGRSRGQGIGQPHHHWAPAPETPRRGRKSSRPGLRLLVRAILEQIQEAVEDPRRRTGHRTSSPLRCERPDAVCMNLTSREVT